MSHDALPKAAMGAPQDPGDGEPESMSEGMEPRGKNQTRMTSEFHSVAYTPPLAELRPEP